MDFFKKIFNRQEKIKLQNDGIRAVGKITLRAYKAGTKELIGKIVQPNMIMQASNTGKNLIVQRLISTNTYSLNVNYGVIGTNSTVVAASDTTLYGESTRAVVALAQAPAVNQATLQFFFPDANLHNGTYREFGMVVDGTATRNSGQLFNRALFSTAYTKVAGTDTTVEVDVELT